MKHNEVAWGLRDRCRGKLLFVILLGFGMMLETPGTEVLNKLDPLSTVRKVADKLVATTPFEFELHVPEIKERFEGRNLSVVDFGSNFGLDHGMDAYAISVLDAERSGPITFELGFYGDIAIWINGDLVYSQDSGDECPPEFKERRIELPKKFDAHLIDGNNQILIRSSAPRSKTWKVYLRPQEGQSSVFLRVDRLPGVDESVGKLCQWLLLGAFSEPDDEVNKIASSIMESGFDAPAIYDDLDNALVWMLPKVELQLQNVDRHLMWNQGNDSWNYHGGGVAWGMMALGEYLKNPEYEAYGNHYCDLYIKNWDRISYQFEQQNGFTGVSYAAKGNPMLDFTSAPAMPFLYRLGSDHDFQHRVEYENLWENVKQYVMNEQVRLPAGVFTREVPEIHTTWVDDMFMSIPFLVHSSLLSPDNSEEQKRWMNEAVKQFFGFNEQVYDAEDHLYHQGSFFNRESSVPYWSRGNGWAAWATSELLEYLPETHPRRTEILEHFREFMARIVYLQRSKGFWSNVLDHPESYDETSGTAIFTYVMAKGLNQGWLTGGEYELAVVRGWSALEQMVEEDGTLKGTCIGTGIGETLEHYFTRPTLDDDTHGILPLLFAAIEVDKFLNEKTRRSLDYEFIF